VEKQCGRDDADNHDRPALLLRGEQGPKLQIQVWDEIVQALKKDVPEVEHLLH
jgi:hypothetical protein